MQQHLARIPRGGGRNRCYQALIEPGSATDFKAEKFPRHLLGALRADALETEGPLPPPQHKVHDEIRRLTSIIQQMEDELLVREVPDDHLTAGQALCDSLRRCTHIWVEKYRAGHHSPPDDADLGDWWLRLLFTFGPQFEEWTELVFISWGSHVLPDLIANIWDGEIEYIENTENTYYDIYKHLARVDCTKRLAQLRIRLNELEDGVRTEPLPHRPCRSGTANPRERGYATEDTITVPGTNRMACSLARSALECPAREH